MLDTHFAAGAEAEGLIIKLSHQKRRASSINFPQLGNSIIGILRLAAEVDCPLRAPSNGKPPRSPSAVTLRMGLTGRLCKPAAHYPTAMIELNSERSKTSDHANSIVVDRVGFPSASTIRSKS